MNRSKAEMFKAISDVTIETKMGEWVYNMSFNKEDILDGKKVIDYVDVLKNIPVVVVGSGPSLDKNIELLKFVKGKAFVLVVDTAFNHVSKFVKPDAVVALDSSEKLKDYIDFELTEGVKLFTELTVDPYIPCEWRGEVVWYCTGFPGMVLDKVIERDFNNNKPIGRLSSGGCVVNAGLSIARDILGSNKIVLLGADCGFYELEKHHHKNADNRIVEKNRLDVDTDIYGKHIYTTGVFQMYASWAENFATEYFDSEINNNDKLYINATEGGIISKGWLIMKLRSAMNMFLNKKYDFSDLFNIKEEECRSKVSRSLSFGPQKIKEVNAVEESKME